MKSWETTMKFSAHRKVFSPRQSPHRAWNGAWSCGSIVQVPWRHHASRSKSWLLHKTTPSAALEGQKREEVLKLVPLF